MKWQSSCMQWGLVIWLSSLGAEAVLSKEPATAAADASRPKIELVGETLANWQLEPGEWQVVGQVGIDPQDPAKLAVASGVGALYNGPNGKTKNLFSRMEHGDVVAHVEFMVPKGSNSGVYFQGRYEIQVFDSWGIGKPTYSDCGGIYQRWRDESKTGYEGHPPKLNASRAPGEWQEFDVVFRAPRFDASGKKISNARFVRVVHNGKVLHEDVEVTGPTRAAAFKDEKPLGPLMLQGDHGPVAYRNVWLKPVDSSD
ncbi:MAG: 3-keto-disaccharide hydrolase [Planctomycetota bacterium]